MTSASTVAELPQDTVGIVAGQAVGFGEASSRALACAGATVVPAARNQGEPAGLTALVVAGVVVHVACRTQPSHRPVHFDPIGVL